MNRETAILFITRNGHALAQRLKTLYPEASVMKFSREGIGDLWKECRRLIFVMATGIVARAIAPLVKDKRRDPAVVVLDEKGRFAISLLSGHLGGANDLAREVAQFLGGEAVITTASDTQEKPSIDLWARENDLAVEEWDLLPAIATRFLDSGEIRVYADVALSLPDGFLGVNDPRLADMVISNKVTPGGPGGRKRLHLRPRNLVAGVGCNSGTTREEIEAVVKGVLGENNLSFLGLRTLATIDKKGREPGLQAFAREYGLEVITYSPEQLNAVRGVERSEAALRATGAKAVAEPAAILASGATALLIGKQKRGNVTVAVAEEGPGAASRGADAGPQHAAERDRKSEAGNGGPSKGKIFIVGTGPGNREHITTRAVNALRESDVIVGYGKYLDLIRDLIKGKEIISTGMTQEVARGETAIGLALSGKVVSVVSGGDPGIYAMAGLIFELLSAEERKTKPGKDAPISEGTAELQDPGASRPSVEVVPGISALNACAARLGAPLMHDFASVSLSDRLTPWNLIEKRLESASRADFVIVLYNPRSKGRVEHIEKARDIILAHRRPETPVGIVKGAMRDDERVIITDLGNMLDHDIDMQTTVIIGNSQTFVWKDWMVTPRGYRV